MISIEELGKRIKIVRELIDISQEEFSKEIASHQSAVSKLENGKGFSLAMFIRIYFFLTKYIDVNELFKEDFHKKSIEVKHSFHND